MEKNDMKDIEIAAIVAHRINRERGWSHVHDVGYITPEQVEEVMAGNGTASHPMTQRIIIEIKAVRQKPQRKPKKKPKTK